jgi:hypothetical protein
MTDHEWLTYKELAQRLGVGIDSARIKAKRRKWPIKPGNHPSEPVRVQVPVTFLAPERTPSASQGSTPRALPSNLTSAPPSAPLVMVSVEIVRELQDRHREQVEQLRADMAAQQARHDAETARQLAARDSLHLDTLGRLQAQAAAERSLWLERIDAAELRSERLEQRLDQVLDQLLQQRQPVASQVEQGERLPEPEHEPWWRRLFGVSSRSDLRRK